MSSVRFVITDDQSASLTQWYDEVPPGNNQAGNAAQLMSQLRLANPDATIYTQHNEATAEQLNQRVKTE